MKYWVYHEGEVPGAYEPHDLAKLPGFSAASLVCPADAASPERRWQRAGLYPDIIEAMSLHDLQPPPAAPASSAAYADPAAATGPDELLNATGHKIFLHVTELMKELENRREEQALTQSLQRTLVDLKGELHAARERIRFLDDRVSTIPATEERERRALEEAERLRAEIRAMEDRLREREARIGQAEQRLQEAALALDNALRGQSDSIREQKRLAQVVEDMNRQLGQKESSLAKSLAMIRRLESELAHLLPATLRAPAIAPPPVPAPVHAGALPDIPKLSSPAAEAPEGRAAPGAPASVDASRPPELIRIADVARPVAEPSVPIAQPPTPAADTRVSAEEPAPSTGPGSIEPATPVPAPWQTALSELASFIKRKIPGGEPDEKP